MVANYQADQEYAAEVSNSSKLQLEPATIGGVRLTKVKKTRDYSRIEVAKIDSDN